MKSWNIKQLHEKMVEDLQACHTNLERTMVKTICGKEIREKAIEFAKTRKLTPGEVAIAQQFGYRGS